MYSVILFESQYIIILYYFKKKKIFLKDPSLNIVKANLRMIALACYSQYAFSAQDLFIIISHSITSSSDLISLTCYTIKHKSI